MKYYCTLSYPWTPGEIVIYYPSPWGIFSAQITAPIVHILKLMVLFQQVLVAEFSYKLTFAFVGSLLKQAAYVLNIE